MESITMTIKDLTVSGSLEEVEKKLALLKDIISQNAVESRFGKKNEASSRTEGQEPTKRPYRVKRFSEVLCAREGCTNHLTREQVERKGKYCSLTCSGKVNQKNRYSRNRAPIELSRRPVTIVAGEGVISGSVG